MIQSLPVQAAQRATKHAMDVSEAAEKGRTTAEYL
jgi:hypothetical protein